MNHNNSTPIGIPRLIAAGFIAGFVSTLVFHQLTLGVLWLAGFAPFGPYAMTPTPPFGIPAVFSVALWGGAWGVVFAMTQTSFPDRGGYWLMAFLFGAIFPSIVALFLVLPLKGKPMGGGFHLRLLVTAFLINGAWGFGTGLILKLLSGLPRLRHKGPPVGRRPADPRPPLG